MEISKKIILALLTSAPLLVNAQGATDAYTLSQNDLKGTARFMSMAGAFGALGGDVSTLNQNPAGIGIYRNSDLGISLDFNSQSSNVRDKGIDYGNSSNFVFNVNNVGYVGAYKLDSQIMPNLNWGFSYSRAASFNRRYRGGISGLKNSMTNYIAATTNNYFFDNPTSVQSPASILGQSQDYDPYIESNAPWMSILAYNSYMINPNSNGSDFQGLMNSKTQGSASFENVESGGIDEYSISWGGNIANKLYWGMSFGVTSVNYNLNSYYGETLTQASIVDKGGNAMVGDADWGLQNQLNTNGTGYNFKMGFIFKPVNEFRLGFAFHTPTYYSLKDEYYSYTSYNYGTGLSGGALANDGYIGETWYQLNTPWKFIASAAAVVAQKAIISFDYEYNGFQTMKVLDDGGREYFDITGDVKNYYRATNTYRIGAEYRLTPQFSVRGGYSYQSSPVTDAAYNNDLPIYTSGTMLPYTFNKSTQYITCGLGYKYKSIYTDIAYVHKNRESEYHGFSPVQGYSPEAKISEKNDRIVFTLGVRF